MRAYSWWFHGTTTPIRRLVLCRIRPQEPADDTDLAWKRAKRLHGADHRATTNLAGHGSLFR